MSDMSIPEYSRAIAYSLARLERELAPELTYHNLWHTREGVMPACLQLARLTGLGEQEMHLLEVAAAFHDIGFTESSANHELVGARIAAQVLPDSICGADQLTPKFNASLILPSSFPPLTFGSSSHLTL